MVPAASDPTYLVPSPDMAAAIACLAKIDPTDPAAREACEHGRALLEVVAGLMDDAGMLRAAALLPALRSGVLDQTAAAGIFGESATRIAAELIRIDARGEPIAGSTVPSGNQAERLRKMLLAAFTDPRLLLVKLAEQLVRLRASKDAPPGERGTLARVTHEIYAPLASRLGVWQLKWELEDLAFRYLEPEHYQQVASWLAAKRVDRERYIDQVIELLDTELKKAGVRAAIAGRPKHIYSIWRKMQRKALSFEQLYDLRAIRILVDTIADCYAALGVVHGLWSPIPGEFDDYIATPKNNLYRSLHTAIIGPEKLPVEVQIRTREMHEQAELGVAAHWRYKEGGRTDSAFEQKIVRLRQLLEPAHRGESAADFLERVRTDLFEDRVYVLSPRGEVVELPSGATPLDYAYQVHTDLGHRCRGAKVNGRMVPLTQPLENGDQIEVLAGKQPNPSRDWLVPSLGYLASPRNRSKVRAWFRKLDEAQNRTQGRQILERELQRLAAHTVKLPELISDFHCANAERLYQAIGEGEISTAQIAGAIQRRARPPELLPSSEARPSTAGAEDTAGILIEGVGDILSTFANCCRPVPPEDIAGYITIGRGVTVHREDCVNLRQLAEESPERVIAVEWGTRGDRTFAVDIVVRAYDRRGLVRDVSAVLADSKINIRTMTTITNEQEGIAELSFRISVHNLEDLSRVLTRIHGLPNVLSAERRV